MNNSDKNYKLWDLSDLKPAEYNPRKISDADYDQLKRSMEKFGTVEPIIVNINKQRYGVIVGGHQRYKAAKELKLTKFPCIEVNLNKTQEKELNVRLNRNRGEFDNKLLASFSKDFLIESGFDEKELNKIFDPNIKKLFTKIKKLKPFNNVHVLISFKPDNAIQVMELLEKTNHIPGIEIEQSSN